MCVTTPTPVWYATGWCSNHSAAVVHHVGKGGGGYIPTFVMNAAQAGPSIRRPKHVFLKPTAQRAMVTRW